MNATRFQNLHEISLFTFLYSITLQESITFRIAQIQYVPTRSSEEIPCILNFPNKTRQQRWSKLELLLIMRIDKPKLLVNNREFTSFYQFFK